MDKEKNISINLKIENFKQDLTNLVNTSNLPISIVYLIWENMSKELEKIYYATLNSESIQNENIETDKIQKVKIEDQ